MSDLNVELPDPDGLIRLRELLGLPDPSNVLTLDGSTPMVADLPMGGHKITGLADPASGQDAATRAYVQAQLAVLTAGANPSIDTFIEAYNRFLTDENAASALTTTVAGKETPSGAQSKADAKVSDEIVDGVVNVAPSQNAVFDALANKQAVGTSLLVAGPSNLTDKTSASNIALRARAQHRYVDYVNGSDFWDGLSEGTPLKTIAAAIALGSNQRITLMPGNHSLGTTETVTLASLQNILVEGTPNATQVIVGGNQDAFSITGTCSAITLEGFLIVSFAARSAGAGIRAVYTGSHHSDIRLDVKVQNTHDGVILDGVDNFWSKLQILQSIAGRMAGDGLSLIRCLSGKLDQTRVAALAGAIGGYGVKVDSDCDTLDFDYLAVAGATLDNIAFRNTVGGSSTGPRLVRAGKVYSEGSAANGLAVLAGRDVHINDLETAGNSLDGAVLKGGEGVYLHRPYAVQNGHYGISVPGSGGDNALGQWGIDHPDCSNNSQAASVTYDGISIAASHGEVQGGKSGDHTFSLANKQRYGIDIAAATDYLTVLGIDLSSNTIGRIRNASTGTHNQIQTAGIGKTRPSLLLAPSGAIAETIDRSGLALANSGVLTSQTLYLQAIALPEGKTINNITFCSGNTAMVAGVNQWFLLIDVAGTILGITADDGATAWGAKVLKTLAVATPYLVTDTGLYYVGCMINAGTVPSLAGIGDIGGVVNVAAPVLCGASATSAGSLTNPASLSGAVARPTAGTAKVYAYVS